jgi:ParB/RepB/Spo0J family partition protein
METGKQKFDVASYLSTAAQDAESIKAADVLYIPVDKIAPNPNQPRKTFRKISLEELAANIKEEGVKQPITVRPIKEPQGEAVFEIVTGERRWKATKIAGLPKIPVIIKDVPDNRMRTEALIENVQREDMTFLDTIRGYVDLREDLGSLDEVVKRVSKDKKTIERYSKMHGEIYSLASEEGVKYRLDVIVTLLENNADRVDRTFIEGFCKVIPDIRRLAKSDKRDYERVLRGITLRLEEQKKSEKGIRSINPWLMKRFKKEVPSAAGNGNGMIRETDKKLVLHIEVSKNGGLSPEMHTNIKAEVESFLERCSLHAQKT